MFGKRSNGRGSVPHGEAKMFSTIEAARKETASGSNSTDVFAARRFRKALRLLMQAKSYAAQVAVEYWEFAIDIGQFRRLGLTVSDLRLLVEMEYLDHAREITSLGDSRRKFQSVSNSLFTRRTCFILTPRGIVAAAESAAARATRARRLRREPISILNQGRSNAPIPHWNALERVLSYDGQTVKRFKCQAINQELVLSAFQEERWPKRILDPLRPRPCQAMKRRLNDTIKCLNRCQIHSLIRFRGDGSSEGVLWEVVS